nr:CHAT domain-containing protein [Bacteroidales bacterium]
IAGFYTYLAQGLDKNVALHRTKVDMISKGSALYSHPYYWAAFTLIGNESAIVSRKIGSDKIMQFVIPILILLAFFIHSKRKAYG